MYKFGTLIGDNAIEFQYDNLFEVQKHPNGATQLAIGAKEKQVQLMLDIARTWPGPFGVLYVLVVPHSDWEPGRYQISAPCDFTDLEKFAKTFEDYFEGDGRHHVWFADTLTGAQLVYDRHNIVYAYGNLAPIVSFLKDRGLEKGQALIPSPHIHQYNEEFDESESAIMGYWDWLYFPLEEED